MSLPGGWRGSTQQSHTGLVLSRDFISPALSYSMPPVPVDKNLLSELLPGSLAMGVDLATQLSMSQVHRASQRMTAESTSCRAWGPTRSSQHGGHLPLVTPHIGLSGLSWPGLLGNDIHCP